MYTTGTFDIHSEGFELITSVKTIVRLITTAPCLIKYKHKYSTSISVSISMSKSVSVNVSVSISNATSYMHTFLACSSSVHGF